MATTTLRREIEYVVPNPPAGDGRYLSCWQGWSSGGFSAAQSSRSAVTKFGMTPGGFKATMPDLDHPHPAHAQHPGDRLRGCWASASLSGRGFWKAHQPGAWPGGWPVRLCLSDLGCRRQVAQPGRPVQYHPLQSRPADPGRAIRHPVRAGRGGQYRHRRHDADGRHDRRADRQHHRQPVDRFAGGSALRRCCSALVHGVLSIKYKTNQIISGTAINIFATGLTSYISAKLHAGQPGPEQPGHFSDPGKFPCFRRSPSLDRSCSTTTCSSTAMFIFLFLIQFGSVLHPLGLAPPGGGRAPAGGRYAGDQRLPHALYCGAPRRDDGRFCRRLLHARLGRSLR